MRTRPPNPLLSMNDTCSNSRTTSQCLGSTSPMCDCSENNSAPATMRPLHWITTTPPTGRLFILSGIFLLQHPLCLPGVFFAALSKFTLERLSPERNNETQFCLSLRASQRLPLSTLADHVLFCLLSGGSTAMPHLSKLVGDVPGH